MIDRDVMIGRDLHMKRFCKNKKFTRLVENLKKLVFTAPIKPTFIYSVFSQGLRQYA